MTKACSLKEAFIETKLNEIQPDWKEGADVTKETKEEIQKRVMEKYQDILDEDSNCITKKSITNTITRIRKRHDIKSKSAKKDTQKKISLPVTGTLEKKPEETKDELEESDVDPEEWRDIFKIELKEKLIDFSKKRKKWNVTINRCINNIELFELIVHFQYACPENWRTDIEQIMNELKNSDESKQEPSE